MKRTEFVKRLYSWICDYWQPLFLFGELFLDLIFIWNGPYHAIDYSAYLDQIRMISLGERDYKKIFGGTGPLVYPAGHVWIFFCIDASTDHGNNRLMGQFIFLVIQMITSYLASEIYKKSFPHPFLCLLFFCTVRARNVYVNGLFNDTIEMMFIYLAIYLLLQGKWLSSLLSFSVAVSTKMSALLFAPSAVLIFISNIGFKKTMIYSIPALMYQILIALPFLNHPWSYFSRSFEFSRQFFWSLSHNWKFLPEEVFLSRWFQITLLFCHIFFLALFYKKFWFSTQILSQKMEQVSCLFIGNFIGVIFSRSLHYSFYIWYFHSLPFLIFHLKEKLTLKYFIFGFSILLAIEICWNQWFPYNSNDPVHSCASQKASFVLTCLHFLILSLLYSKKVLQDFLPISI